MFTKKELDLEALEKEDHPFAKAHGRIKAILKVTAPYSEEATLNPGDTREFPEEMEDLGGRCVILDSYSPGGSLGPGGMGLMLVMEVFRSEMEPAMEEGSAVLFEKLRAAGHYPYSDLDRRPVVGSP
jgi:hypothetical protein